MNKSTVVKVQNISKTYKLYDKPIDRVKESLNPFKKKYHKEFYALNDISFELKRGEALGVIGRNGNGKSTLLKIISGVLTPTKGHINTKGKISAILELTSSLKPELTGLENIELNLKISGFKQNELKEKIKEIEEFAQIGEFINQPVKTYSSGMKSRLGFGIATSSEPDILILDEVLAVGDFNFQQKCLAKINAMRDRISMIFVSHSMNSVRLFCDNVLVLEKGKKAFYGKAEDGIKYYLEQEESKKQEENKNEITKNIKPFYGDLFHNKDKILNIRLNWMNNEGKLITKSYTYENISIYIEFELSYKPKNLIIGLPIFNENGNYITGISNDMSNTEIIPYKDNKFKIKFNFKNILNSGKYYNILAIQDGSEFLYRNLNSNLEVINNSRNFGFVSIEHTWDILKDKKMKDKYNNFSISFDNSDDYKSWFNEINKSFTEITEEIFGEICKKVLEIDNLIDGRFGGEIKDLIAVASSRYVTSSRFSDYSVENLAHVEIGTLFGGTAILTDFVIKELSLNDKFKNIMIDPLSGYYDNTIDFVSGLEVTKERLLNNFDKFNVKNFELLQYYSTDEQVIQKIKKFNIVSLFIDGDHSFSGLLKDWNNYNELVIKGGHIIIDNVNDKNWPNINIFIQVLKSRLLGTFKIVYEGNITIILEKLIDEGLFLDTKFDVDLIHQIEQQIDEKFYKMISYRNEIVLKKNEFIEKQKIMIEKRDNEIIKKDEFIEKQKIMIEKRDDSIIKKNEFIEKQKIMIEKRDNEIIKKDEFIEKQKIMIEKRDDSIIKKDEFIEKQNIMIDNIKNLIEKILNSSFLKRLLNSKNYYEEVRNILEKK